MTTTAASTVGSKEEKNREFSFALQEMSYSVVINESSRMRPREQHAAV